MLDIDLTGEYKRIAIYAGRRRYLYGAFTGICSPVARVLIAICPLILQFARCCDE